MKSVAVNSSKVLSGTRKPRMSSRFARAAVLGKLAGLRGGSLVVEEDGERQAFGEVNANSGIHVTIVVKDSRFYREIAFGGSIGVGEAYMLGYWSCSSLTNLVRLFVRNRELLEGLEGGLAMLSKPLFHLFAWANRNSRDGSRRNISAHYDLGNEFFRLWLDERMMYSSAVFEDPAMSLEQASEAKLRRICEKLALSEKDHLLEIGTGWGGLAIYAAGNYGCRVTTTTISREQYEEAKARIKAAGLQDRVTLLLEDYRDLKGQYDKLVSVEMIEAIGHQYLDTYFKKCASLLKPDGLMLLQSITINDQRYEAAKKSVDFIQRYIFPGGCLMSVTAMAEALTRVTDMRIFHLDDIGPHYARTLAAWRERFWGKVREIRDMGYPEEFLRMWDYYFCYCEGAFIERYIGDVQLLLTKPLARRAALAESS
ncbi:SAM-dependent methyltransferase [Biformimicrobium ophioploci]|uniref:Cyclopropane-fatty-acyl-phospholipid synthase family protein n=1 Tax=Biformimicrobium ophioploci TaxID=3036711 RepID=A0ABQ6LYT8_9GAMM|nr:cyclopropane-fatty-acyl-phospholipid synthase family protein [Microbulbifer sp. NKW57]GMG87250.1 cyclopropane-fatty-acyl-phospholipid synthase family protein [Microbulbifer sp. NKW57]